MKKKPKSRIANYGEEIKKGTSDFKEVSIIALKRFFRWRSRVIWKLLGGIISFLTFLVVWTAIVEGGFQSLGMLTKDNYITFLLTGALLWSVIKICLTDMSHSFIIEKHRKTLPYVMMSPVNRIAYMYGRMSQPALSIIINNVPVLILGFLVGFQFHGNMITALLIFLLTFTAFSGIGIILASLASWKEGIQDGSYVLKDALYFISGVHYPLAVFPDTFEKAFRFLPTTRAIDALRAVGIEGATLSQVSGTLIYLAVMSVITITLGVIIFKKIEKKAMLLGI